MLNGNNIDRVIPRILGREESFLVDEMMANEAKIVEQLRDAKVLVIGAAGSIGASFVKVLSDYKVDMLHLIDVSESNLAELVRDFRSSGKVLPRNFKTFAIDFSGPEMAALLSDEEYDYVLNFAALKHVRSERDPYTLMRLLKVNVSANHALCESLKKIGGTRMVFSVSSDKSVKPANLMGASKAFMERVFLHHSDTLPFTSARFANVAFSDGSLLDSFRKRLAKGQPLSAPSDVRRYFISHREAGELCFLGCFAGANKEIVYPKLEQSKDMMTFSEIAKVYLEESGYEPEECESDEEAIRKSGELTSGSKKWPCHFSQSDTSGEKMYEEFVDPKESIDEGRYPHLGVVTAPIEKSATVIESALDELERLRDERVWGKEDLVAIIKEVVPELEHVTSDKNLDQKM